ncbi:hypothetical protein [uncultured Porphyromonas sp.]|jgi:hypothetical protein|uniref:hypothetical protein n=1 Tax=uncultured Porphyromonas sp. TaxID=159274 RepID=UPI00280379F4|nr:hypothetical protein [uncultured Porphyromonas sp.]
MKQFYFLLCLLGLLSLSTQLQADTWTYDFEDFAKQSNGEGALTQMNVTLNGLDWHMCGVTNSGGHWSDWKNGESSLKVFGQVYSSAKEMTNITLVTKRDLGTLKFWIRSNERWFGDGRQVSWIIQWSADGETWVTVGDPFVPADEPSEVVREINQRNAQLRIVREDYQTFDYTKPTESFANVFHLDDMTITDMGGATPAPTLTTTAGSEIDFGEITLGESVEKSFTISYAGLDEKPTLQLQGDDKADFTIASQETKAEGEDEVKIVCKASQRGNHTASLEISYGELKVSVVLKMVGKKKNNTKLYSGGDGTKENPYLISSAEDLMELSSEVEGNQNPYADTYFKMTANISMADAQGFRPIGNDWGRDTSDPTRFRPFSGIFDGDGHAITDLNVEWTDKMFSGLFGIVKNATIKNLTLSKSKIYGSAGLGGMVGVAMGSITMENCHTTSDVTVWSNSLYAGGLIAGALFGDASKTSRISSCTNAATVKGEMGGIGGIIGVAGHSGLIIERCGNYGSVSDKNSTIGGIVAIVSYPVVITDCFNVGYLEAADTQDAENTRSGGIVGDTDLAEGVQSLDEVLSISNCYSIGESNKKAPKFHPIFDATKIASQVKLSNNYYSSDVYGEMYDQNVTGEAAAIDVSLKEMKTEEFLNKLNHGRKVWSIISGENNGYPVPFYQEDNAVETPTAALDIVVRIETGYLVVEGDYSAINLYNIHGVQLDPTALLERGVYVVRVIVDGQSAVYKLVY